MTMTVKASLLLLAVALMLGLISSMDTRRSWASRAPRLGLKGWAIVAAYVLGVLAFAVALTGCSDASASPPPPPARPAGAYQFSPRGVHVWVPYWLDRHPALRTEALKEVDETAPEANSGISAGTAGPPAGWAVVIMDPGKFSAPASPTGLARGLCDYASRTVYVSWWMSEFETGARMPALPHEYTHAYTGDPLAGH